MTQTDKEYAEGLFSLCLEENLVNEISAELETIKQALEQNPDYIELLMSPAIPLTERMTIIDELLVNNHEYVVSFVKLICEKGYASKLIGAIDEYQKLVSAMSGKTKAVIYSAVQLDDKQKQAVCLKIEKLIGKQPEPEYIVDKSLIGGIRIETDGKVYDGSVRHQLLDVKDVIIR